MKQKIVLGFMRLDTLIGILIAVPCVVFIVSYSYLAFYHQKLYLFNTIIHENGRDTLLRTIFYWDHFLGMLPHLLIIIPLLVSAFMFYGPSSPVVVSKRVENLLSCQCFFFGGSSLLIIFIIFIFSLKTIGWQETMVYLFQHRERINLVTSGGNWKMMMTADIGLGLILFFIVANLRMVVLGQSWRNQQGWSWIFWFAVALFVVMSLMCGVTTESFFKPRWLAHNIREFATFPLTVFPICLSALFLLEKKIYAVDSSCTHPTRQYVVFHIGLLALLLGIFIGWHLIFALSEDISAMAQKPAFAKDGRLSIFYLLAFHYFEHVLDLIFSLCFAIFSYCLIIYKSTGSNLGDKAMHWLVARRRIIRKSDYV